MNITMLENRMHCRHDCMLHTVQGKEGASLKRKTGDVMEAYR